MKETKSKQTKDDNTGLKGKEYARGILGDKQPESLKIMKIETYCPPQLYFELGLLSHPVCRPR